MYDYTKAFDYRAIIEIEEESYQATAVQLDGREVGKRFTLDDTTREQVAGYVRQAIDERSDPKAVRVEPGYIEAVVDPSPPGYSHKVTPADVLDAIRRGVHRYNDRHAMTVPGEGALDALELGAEYVAVRSAGDVEAWMDRHVGVEETDHPDYGVPEDTGEPIYVYGELADPGPLDGDGVARDISLDVRVPFDPEQYCPDIYRRESGLAVPFRWDEYTLGALEDNLDRYLSGRIRVEVWVDHLRVRVGSGNIRKRPESVINHVMSVIERVNNRRGMVSVHEDGPEQPKGIRPPLTFAREAYIGVDEDAPDRAEEWIAAHGLDDPDLAAMARGIETEVDDLLDRMDRADGDGATDAPEAADDGGRVTASRLRKIFGG